MSLRTTVVLFVGLVLSRTAPAQQLSLNKGWKFYHPSTKKWYPATVPGTIHTDLLSNHLIPDPYFRNNEATLQWIDTMNWEYVVSFDVPRTGLQDTSTNLVFNGLDTYAEVYLNNKLLFRANNMFRQWRINVSGLLRPQNTLSVRFKSAKNTVDSIARSKLPLVLPDNPRVYARKAQYHFGWDWGPKFVTSGIWKSVYLESISGFSRHLTPDTRHPSVELIQQPDSIGRSFYFQIDGKPVYMKGANWIPGDMFLPRLTKDDYRRMIKSARDANMNMLRVWGGGVYEDDAFYELCDEYGIYVWQDFMFAGGMVPGDEAFLQNVHEEVKYQIERLKNYKCIVLWCGNNEIDEAWHNWGWQKQFNLHDTDSAMVWKDYKRLFQDSLPVWVKRYDGARPYVSTSPMHGWGRPASYKEGDSHYWGIWWGLADIESFETKTGRFVSEYGMQAMPTYATIRSFTAPGDRFLFSEVLKSHQKASAGFDKLMFYLDKYFLDSAKVKRLSLKDYTYLTQCLQYYTLKNSIAIHRGKYPGNMGTLLWQLNDCWPVASWSITDFSRQPKAAWYAVREAYRDDVLPQRDTLRPKQLMLKNPTFTIKVIGDGTFSLQSDVDAYYVEVDDDVSDNYFNLKAGELKTLKVQNRYINSFFPRHLKIKSLYDVVKH